MFQATREATAGKNRPAPLVRLNRWHISRSLRGAQSRSEASSQHAGGAVSSEGKKPYRVEVGGKIFEGSDTRALLRLAVEARRAQKK